MTLWSVRRRHRCAAIRPPYLGRRFSAGALSLSSTRRFPPAAGPLACQRPYRPYWLSRPHGKRHRSRRLRSSASPRENSCPLIGMCRSKNSLKSIGLPNCNRAPMSEISRTTQSTAVSRPSKYTKARKKHLRRSASLFSITGHPQSRGLWYKRSKRRGGLTSLYLNQAAFSLFWLSCGDRTAQISRSRGRIRAKAYRAGRDRLFASGGMVRHRSRQIAADRGRERHRIERLGQYALSAE